MLEGYADDWSKTRLPDGTLVGWETQGRGVFAYTKFVAGSWVLSMQGWLGTVSGEPWGRIRDHPPWWTPEEIIAYVERGVPLPLD